MVQFATIFTANIYRPTPLAGLSFDISLASAGSRAVLGGARWECHEGHAALFTQSLLFAKLARQLRRGGLALRDVIAGSGAKVLAPLSRFVGADLFATLLTRLNKGFDRFAAFTRAVCTMPACCFRWWYTDILATISTLLYHCISLPYAVYQLYHKYNIVAMWDRKSDWRMAAAEHCPTCQTRAAGNPYTVEAA